MTRRQMLSLASAPLAGLPSLAAQTPAEIAKLEKLLVDGGKRFLALIEPLKPEQWSHRVPSIRHSIGEEAEHIALSENELQQVILTAMQRAPDEGAPKRLEGKEKQVEEVLLGKEAAAESFNSPGKLVDKSEVLEFFPSAHRRLLELFRQVKDRPMTQHVFEHPSDKLGELQVVQWFYYIAHHRERHMRQIEAIQAHSSYPGAVKSA